MMNDTMARLARVKPADWRDRKGCWTLERPIPGLEIAIDRFGYGYLVIVRFEGEVYSQHFPDWRGIEEASTEALALAETFVFNVAALSRG